MGQYLVERWFNDKLSRRATRAQSVTAQVHFEKPPPCVLMNLLRHASKLAGEYDAAFAQAEAALTVQMRLTEAVQEQFNAMTERTKLAEAKARHLQVCIEWVARCPWLFVGLREEEVVRKFVATDPRHPLSDKACYMTAWAEWEGRIADFVAEDLQGTLKGA